MDKFIRIAAYVTLAIMALAALLLLGHYAGLLTGAKVVWLWAFVWGPPAIVAGGFLAVVALKWMLDFLSW